MNAQTVTTRWLRKVRRLTWVLIGVPVVVGLGYTWRAAWRAEVLAAAVGAAATLGVLGIGLLFSGLLRVGLGLVRGGRRVARLDRRLGTLCEADGSVRRRLDHLSHDQEKLRGQTDQDARRLGEALKLTEDGIRKLEQHLAGIEARVEAFSKLHDDQADRLDRRLARLEGTGRLISGLADSVRIDSHWADDSTPPGEHTVTAFQHLVGQGTGGEGDAPDRSSVASERQRLRLDFASLIHRHEYEAALMVGDELANRFADSAAAADFRRVRPHLVRKIQLLKTAAVVRSR